MQTELATQPTFVASANIPIATLTEMQRAFRNELEILHHRRGMICIKPTGRHLDRFRDLLLRSGLNVHFQEAKLDRAHI